MIRVMVEAATDEICTEYVNQVVNVMKEQDLFRNKIKSRILYQIWRKILLFIDFNLVFGYGLIFFTSSVNLIVSVNFSVNFADTFQLILFIDYDIGSITLRERSLRMLPSLGRDPDKQMPLNQKSPISLCEAYRYAAVPEYHF